MTAKIYRTSLILTLALILIPQVCPAQGGDYNRDSNRSKLGNRSGDRMQRSGGDASSKRFIEMLTSLGVTQRKAERLAKEFKALNQTRRSLAKKEIAVIQELGELLQSEKAGSKTISKLIGKIEKIRIKKIKTMEEEFALMKKHLTPQQYAHVLVERSKHRQRPGQRWMGNDRRGGRGSDRPDDMRRGGRDSDRPDDMRRGGPDSDGPRNSDLRQ